MNMDEATRGPSRLEQWKARLARSNRPLLMGVLNVTPDSFSDGGRFLRPEVAASRASTMIAEGADIVDVGGESTRPGASPVPAATQVERTRPVIEALRAVHPDTLISIDTRRSAVAQQALSAGADIVNDVSALRDDPTMADLARQYEAPVVLMHMRGRPDSMQQGEGPFYRDVVGEVTAFLRERVEWCAAQGIKSEQIILDPGVGFGKRLEDNLQLLRGLDHLRDLGPPLLLGASRKSFMGRLLGLPDPADRLIPSIACAIHAMLRGVRILRVHDVGPTRLALDMMASIAGPAQTE